MDKRGRCFDDGRLWALLEGETGETLPSFQRVWYDNLVTGYGVWMPEWTWDAEAWKGAIEDAYRRSQTLGSLISNVRLKITVNAA